MQFEVLFALLSAFSVVQSATWNLKEKISGDDYNDKFDYMTDKDPTGGLVVYQSEQAAKDMNLTRVDNDNFVMRVDTTKTQTEGRPSVRLESKDHYEDSVLILQFTHVPTGCAVWPAFWTTTVDDDQWPKGGEIDILENVNDQYPYNLASLHVEDDCSVSGDGKGGTVVFPNCNAMANEQSGCRIAMNNTKTAPWGKKLNNKGGGTVAMERDFSESGKGIRMWFWDKSQNLPDDISNPGKTVNPDGWGTPNADFGKLKCSGGSDGSNQFDAHKIVFDITLCGDWAGNDEVYSQVEQCPAKYQACSNQVGQAGESFEDAYWEVQNLYIYESSKSSSAALYTKPAWQFSFAAALVTVLTFTI